MNIDIYQTAKDSPHKLWNRIESSPYGEGFDLSLLYDTAILKQKIRGFGGAFTEASAYVWEKLSKEKQVEILNAYFSPESGIGYTLGRTHMNSCDFSLGNYAAADRAGDVTLDYFDTEREEKSIWKMIQEAQRIAKNKIPLLLSPWSPPAWMKSNGTMNNGGYLLPEYFLSWARYYPKYIKRMEKYNLDVFAITVQNEPEATQTWDSCRYTGIQEGEFIANYLGPTLKREGIDTEIYALDHNRDILYKRVVDVTSVEKATDYITGFAIHWYSGSDFDQLEKTQKEFPQFKYIFSEGCIEGGVKLGQWDRGERYAHHIIGDFNAGISIWLDWNLLLDKQGGPNHVGNFCDAPIIGDTENGDVYYQNSFAYIGHFSKYIKPGAQIIGHRVEGNDSEEIECLTAKNPDNTIVSVILNKSKNEYKLNFNNTSLLTIKPNSITTVVENKEIL